MNATNPYSPPNSEVGEQEPEPVSAPEYELNPWFTMWTQPRATIQQIIETNPERAVVPLACAAGLSGSLDRASMNGAGDKLDLAPLLVVIIVIGPLAGLAYLYLGAAALRWTGAWIGGVASSQHIRAAIAWSNLPAIYALVLWVPQLALFGKEIFMTATPTLDANPIPVVGFALADVTIAIWTIVLVLKSLSQVQRFSVWKTVGNLLLASAIIVLPVIGLAFGIASLA